MHIPDSVNGNWVHCCVHAESFAASLRCDIHGGKWAVETSRIFKKENIRIQFLPLSLYIFTDTMRFDCNRHLQAPVMRHNALSNPNPPCKHLTCSIYNFSLNGDDSRVFLYTRGTLQHAVFQTTLITEVLQPLVPVSSLTLLSKETLTLCLCLKTYMMLPASSMRNICKM